jgi:hypothetical protein
MSSQVNSIIRSCFYYIRRLRSVRCNLTAEAAKTITSACILSRMDYCNGLLTGITQRQCDRLQRVLNTTARVIYGGGRFDHVTPVLRDKLHWLRFRQRVTYKLCLLVYNSTHGRAPRYVNELVVSVANPTTGRRLRSASTLLVRKPATKKKLGERGFSFAAPAAWNALPETVQSCTSIDSFKSHLKTHLFNYSYPV